MATAVEPKKKPKRKRTYRLRDGFHVPVKAEVVGPRIEALKRRHDGILAPAVVVDDARPEDAPLHPCFEWDDSVAGEKYRETQARNVINCYLVTEEIDGEETQYIANVCVTLGEERGYVSSSRILTEEEVRRQEFEEMEGMYLGLRRRGRMLPGCEDFLSQIVSKHGTR